MNSPFKIVITGPESTGKSVLTRQLADHFKGYAVDEFAREYISDLGRPYTYHDVELIARRQVLDLDCASERHSLIFMDTYLIITKVWFEVVYKDKPPWLEGALLNSGVNLFLLCAPDIPWEKDSVRENGGEMRNWLFKEYEKNLIKYNFAYKIVEGFGNVRFQNALNIVESYLNQRE